MASPSSEPRRDPDDVTRRRRRVPIRVLLVAVLTLVVVPAGAVATTPFTDVDAGSVHATGIGWLVDAGVTAGCTPTEYCPSANVRRDQMATFMHRLSGNAPATPPSVNAAALEGRSVASLQEIALQLEGMQLGGGAIVELAGTLDRGIRLPEAQSVPSFASSVVVPAAKEPAQAVYLDVYWHIDQASCSVSLRDNFVRVRRVGTVSAPSFALVPDGGLPTLVAPATPGETTMTRYRFNSGIGLHPEAGDAIAFGLFRATAGSVNQPDTCTQDMIVTGMAIRFG
jgi:hypothetical protein